MINSSRINIYFCFLYTWNFVRSRARNISSERIKTSLNVLNDSVAFRISAAATIKLKSGKNAKKTQEEAKNNFHFS